MAGITIRAFLVDNIHLLLSANLFFVVTIMSGLLKVRSYPCNWTVVHSPIFFDSICLLSVKFAPSSLFAQSNNGWKFQSSLILDKHVISSEAYLCLVLRNLLFF
jgi:hypothetical protein